MLNNRIWRPFQNQALQGVPNQGAETPPITLGATGYVGHVNQSFVGAGPYTLAITTSFTMPSDAEKILIISALECAGADPVFDDANSVWNTDEFLTTGMEEHFWQGYHVGFQYLDNPTPGGLHDLTIAYTDPTAGGAARWSAQYYGLNSVATGGPDQTGGGRDNGSPTFQDFIGVLNTTESIVIGAVLADDTVTAEDIEHGTGGNEAASFGETIAPRVGIGASGSAATLATCDTYAAVGFPHDITTQARFGASFVSNQEFSYTSGTWLWAGA